jgi:hypothetical protein
MTTHQFFAGAASRAITPPLGERPVFLAGFQGDRRAIGVQSDLYVRALALRFDERVAVIVACDLIGLLRPDVEDIRPMLAARDIDPDALIVACTHTYSGPDTIGLWGLAETSSGVDPLYMVALKRAIVQAVEEALLFSCPVRMRAATSKLPAHSAGDRGPGLLDDEIAVLQFERPNGETLATLLNLAYPSAALGAQSTLISADYAGAACRAVEQAAGGLAIHISGALGPTIAAPEAADIAPIASAYAEAALAALAKADLAEVTRLDMRRATFQLPIENPLLLAAHAAGVLRQRPLEDQQLTTSCAYIDLGPAQIIAVPAQLPPHLGVDLKAGLRGPVRILAGLVDDALGDAPPDGEAHGSADGGLLYGLRMSAGPRTGALVLEAAQGLIKRVEEENSPV